MHSNKTLTQNYGSTSQKVMIDALFDLAKHEIYRTDVIISVFKICLLVVWNFVYFFPDIKGFTLKREMTAYSINVLA